MPDEPENTIQAPLTFLKPLQPIIHSPSSPRVKIKTTSTLHSDDLKRIFSDRIASKPVISDDTPKQSESVDSGQDISIINNTESLSNITWSTQSDLDSENLALSHVEDKSKEPWGSEVTEDEPMFENSSGSGENKQELFMQSLNLCKQSACTSSLLVPQFPRKMESRSDRKKSLESKQISQYDFSGKLLHTFHTYSQVQLQHNQ